MSISNLARVAIAALSLSGAGLIGIAINEGYTDRAVIPVKDDVPTLGFGSTRNVRMGDTTNPIAALKRLGHEVNTEYEAALKRCVKVDLHQHEYDVYVDHAYNVGAEGFCNSTIVRRLNQRDYKGACDAILMWKKYKGFDCSTPGNKVCYGLWKRRLESRAKCLGEHL